MVVIHVKRTEADQFLYECSIKDSNDKVIRDLANIWNMREKIGRLAGALCDLAKHGPAKPEKERGLDDVQEKAGAVIHKGPHYCPDPLGNRTGDAPSPQLADVLNRTAQEAMAAVSKAQFSSGIALTVAGLSSHIDTMRGAVTMAYPMGLPEYDLIRQLFEDADGAVLESLMGAEYMDPSTVSLWWAGKEFFRDACVGDRVGRNEKTKIVARLQKEGAGAPVREPAVSEEERRAMMAWVFKKQEEDKALAEDNDDSYLGGSTSGWADPKALKSALLGTSAIRWGGAGRR